ncbi:TPA: hypothetical protein DCG61_03175 [Patescibacteria group bacterium]|jgi:hypothetical protein|nr:hypothetical protein [Patescibacteria group bacterium]
MEKYKPNFNFESSLPQEWYFNDEIVSKIYQKISEKELSATEVESLYRTIQEELSTKLDEHPAPTGKQLEEIQTLNNIARELNRYIRTSKEGLPDDDGVINTGERIH